MKLEGLHHITMITGDANATVAFYADTLGLRLVKKTVNFDQPDAYHLYFGDETGAPGSILTWFEFPGAAPGSAGIGDIHTLQLGVASAASLDFWADAARRARSATADVLRFADPDGLALELVRRRQPAAARRPPGDPGRARDHRSRGRPRVRRLRERRGAAPDRHARASPGSADGEYRLDGAERRFRWAYDAADRATARRARARSTTSPGPRATRTTSPGRRAWPTPAAS